MVITKDLSRLGRDYIQTGQYTEIYFPTKKVRYIAINDGYDSDSPCTDIAPFKNIINEMYARDISKKIRSSFTTHMQEGAFVGAFAPYGYMRDPADKHHLVIDREAAKIVREIFLKASEGILPIDIARELNRRMVPTPLEYRRNQRVAEETEEFESGEDGHHRPSRKCCAMWYIWGIWLREKLQKYLLKAGLPLKIQKKTGT